MPEPGKIKKKKPHRFYDYSLLFTIIFLTVFGLIMIYSASSYKAQLDYGNPGYFMLRQAGIAGVSFVAMYIVSKIDYHWFARFAMLGYIASYVTLLLTRFTPLGVASHGKKRWLRLGPLQFQPTEIVKISLILLLAVLIANLGVRINQLRAVGFIVALSAPLALLVTANNLSSGIIICGIVFHWGWVSWITLMILAVMIGLLLFTIVLTRRADNVGYKQMEGKSGAAISILGNMKRAGFDFPQEPVWVDPRTRDAVWRGTGYQGIYLIGEGNYGRVMQAMDRQEKQIKGVTAGSHIPVYRICVGDGPKQVRLKDLRNTVLKKKTYVPNNYTNPIMRKLHPRHRFALSKPQLITLNDRLHTLQRRSGMGIPKGMDPMKTHKVSRRAIRGR